MSKSPNPYEILKIQDFSAIDDVETAFTARIQEYEELGVLTPKQANLHVQLHEAYDILTNPNTKKIIDDELRFKSYTQQNVRTATNLSPLDKANQEDDSFVEKEFDRTKPVNSGAKQSQKNMFTVFIFGLMLLILGGFFLNILKSDDSKQRKAAQELELAKNKATTPTNTPAPPTPVGLIAPSTSIQGNILYPDPIVFKQPNLIYAPDGSVFPVDAGLIPTLPQTASGEGSIMVHNPRPSAIFGKLVLKYTETMTPSVIRYFYIPPKQSLEISHTPNGIFQIQILTLDKPAVFVSPSFTVPLYSEAQTTMIANWDYPQTPESVF